MYTVWTVWLLFLIVSFSILEGYALGTDKLTLSMFTWKLTEAWGPLPFFLGMLSGGLAVHFWWHWLPPGSTSNG